MTFSVRENSNYDGQPVTLYEFRRGAARLLYANADQDIQAGADLYVATAIEDGGNQQKGTAVTDTFDITVPISTAIAGWYAFTPPSDTVYIVVRRFHYGDANALVVWMGNVISSSVDKDGKVTLSCHAISVSLKRGGLRLAWQRGCPHAIYDSNCKVDKAAHAFATTVLNVTNSRVYLTDAPPVGPAWAGGFAAFEIVPGAIENRVIADVEMDILTPFGDLDGYQIGMTITLYPGCLRTSAWCANFYDNYVNYGGFSFMPNRTPYNGDPVF